jgi:hypothetical protein
VSEGDLLAYTIRYGGGADLRSGRAQIPETRGINYLNVVLDEYGGVGKRPGSLPLATLGAGAVRTLSQFVWYRDNGIPLHMVHLSDGTVHSSPDLITYTQRLSGVSTLDPFCFAGGPAIVASTTVDKLYFTNNTNGLYSWDGTAATAGLVAGIGSAKPRWIVLWKDTMWTANEVTNRSMVRGSAPGNGDSWPATVFVTVGRGDGDQIMGLFPEPNNLIVGKQRRIFGIEDATTTRNRIVDPDKGVESHFSFVTADDGIYFLSRKGICRLQIQAPAEIVSRNIEPLFTQEVINLQRLSQVWGYKYADTIGWTIPEAGQQVPTIQVAYYPGLPEKPFCFHRGPWKNFATWRSGTVEKLIAGSTVSNKLLEAMGKTGTDDGVPFQGVVESAPINLNRVDIIKYLAHVSLVGRGKMNVSFKRNYEDVRYRLMSANLGQVLPDTWNDEDWNEGIWGPRSTYNEDILHPDMYFENVVVELRDNETSEGIDRIQVGDEFYLLGEGRQGAWAVHKIDLRCVEMGMVDHESRLSTVS